MIFFVSGELMEIKMRIFGEKSFTKSWNFKLNCIMLKKETLILLISIKLFLLIFLKFNSN